ncbi:polysaccharide deacetylase family protein [Clostridium sp. MB40-C1]|uniref:polysaccharide deacetylase family protein n=1 Tax=Clostridium sp. MB40-C1 TaxID=3070996 RepID=UPI0027E08629|nr:polysaccharide deacetylase family protein [Clostridium sp. MB40-C1]WMJ80761.1 polysaccharide deacetylase family protein [Clostridium sp. MB40-C1]
MIKKTSVLCLILSSFLLLTACSLGNNKSSSLKKEVSKTDLKNNSSASDGISKNSADLTNANGQANSNTNKVPCTKVKGSIPVLMYHSVGFEKDNPVRIPTDKFDKQMKYLKDNGFHTLSLDETYDYFSKGKAIPEKSIVLTFDDGYLDNYTRLYPILKKYEFKGAIFVITGAIDTEKDFLNSNQLKELDKSCLDIQSHTFAHEKLSEISYDKQVKTLKASKDFLEKQLNKKVNYLAYPYGKYTKSTIKAAKEAGYLMAFTTDGKWSDKSNGIFTLNRVYISGFSDMDTFIKKVNDPNY